MSANVRRLNIRRISKPLLIGVVALFVVNIAFYLFFIRPDRLKLDDLEGESAPQVVALEELRKQVVGFEAYLEGLRQAENDIQYFRTDILSTRALRMVDVQGELEKLCREFRIDCNSVHYDNEILPAEGIDLLRMIVPLQGGYAALRDFLQAVENSEKFMVVKQVVLGKTGRDGRMLELAITVDAYFDAPPELLRRG
jgi:hypothetical protein